MPARAANSGEASNAQDGSGAFAFTHLSSLHLRQRSLPGAAEIASRMRIAQPRNSHLVDKADGLAVALYCAYILTGKVKSKAKKKVEPKAKKVK